MNRHQLTQGIGAADLPITILSRHVVQSSDAVPIYDKARAVDWNDLDVNTDARVSRTSGTTWSSRRWRCDDYV